MINNPKKISIFKNSYAKSVIFDILTKTIKYLKIVGVVMRRRVLLSVVVMVQWLCTVKTALGSQSVTLFGPNKERHSSAWKGQSKQFQESLQRTRTHLPRVNGSNLSGGRQKTPLLALYLHSVYWGARLCASEQTRHNRRNETAVQ